MKKARVLNFQLGAKNLLKLISSVYGALMVWRKGKEGHIAFVYGKDIPTEEIIAIGGNQDDRITFMLKSDTTKQFQNYYIPVTYIEEAKLSQELSSFDIVELNKTIAGYTGYKRKMVTRDR